MQPLLLSCFSLLRVCFEIKAPLVSTSVVCFLAFPSKAHPHSQGARFDIMFPKILIYNHFIILYIKYNSPQAGRFHMISDGVRF
jgi:hypothetical protein